MRQADQQARPSDMPGLDGIAGTGIGTPCVPHRGNPQLQGPPQLRHRLQQPVRGRAAGVRQAGESHVSVAVDQARKKRQTGAVDPLIAIETRCDVRDAPVLDGDVSRADRAASRVEDSSAVQQRSHAGSIPPLPGTLNPKGRAPWRYDCRPHISGYRALGDALRSYSPCRNAATPARRRCCCARLLEATGRRDLGPGLGWSCGVSRARVPR